jgi:NitT/TauT family transport system substrate-binding protein
VIRLARLAATVLVVAWAGAGAGAAEPLALHIGWATAPSHIQPLIDALQTRHPEIFAHVGKSYTAEGLRFAGSSPQIQGMAAGQLEIAAFSPSALALAIVNAHLDVRIIADCLQDGIDGHFSVPYVVRADGPIKTIEDVKGKRIASNAVGSSNDAAMRVMLHRNSVQDADFVTVETNFSNMPAMIDGNKVDLIPVMPQFVRPLIASGKYRVLFTQMDAVGPAQTVLWAMQPDFIKRHRAALVDFFEDHLRAVRWFLDPAHHAEAIVIAQFVTKEPAENLDYVFTKEDIYRSPDGMPNMPAVQHEIDEMVGLGVVPQRIAVAPAYVDLSLIEEAKARLDGK